MKKALLSLSLLWEAALSSLHAATMASQPWVTNRISQAEARLSAEIVAATNAIPVQDLSPYVRNDKSNTDVQDIGGLIAPFGMWLDGGWSRLTAHNGSSLMQGLPEYISSFGFATKSMVSAAAASSTNYTDAVAAEFENGTRTVDNANHTYTAYIAETIMDSNEDAASWSRILDESTNAARAVVREMSLGGIWDRELGVWWTPVMSNGALTYQATTNVNLNVEGD